MNRMLGLVIIGILCLSMFGLLAPKVNANPSPNARATYTVWPTNGYDDTANIQAAFDAAVAHGPGCTVQLEKGTYYTAQITVYGFQGSFVGMGQQWTTIQALPNLPSPAAEYNTNTIPFWAGLPGPQNPWPNLFTFVGGSFAISGMTLTDPYTAPTMGWDLLGTPYTSLYAAIEITGQKQASATIDHVTVLGASGDAVGPSTFNMWNGIIYWGQLLPEGWTDALAQMIPISGSFSVTNSVFNSEESGPWFGELVNAKVTVCYNTITNSYGSTGFYDAYNSKIIVCGNRISNVIDFGGIVAGQDTFVSGTTPSTVYITDNQILQVSQGASAVLLYDYNTKSTLNTVVIGNTITGSYVGVWVDHADGTLVTDQCDQEQCAVGHRAHRWIEQQPRGRKPREE